MYLLSYQQNMNVSTKLLFFLTKQNYKKIVTRKKERLI